MKFPSWKVIFSIQLECSISLGAVANQRQESGFSATTHFVWLGKITSKYIYIFFYL